MWTIQFDEEVHEPVDRLPQDGEALPVDLLDVDDGEHRKGTAGRSHGECSSAPVGRVSTSLQ